MNLTADDILRLCAAGNRVRIAADGSIDITPIAGGGCELPMSATERTRRRRARLKEQENETRIVSVPGSNETNETNETVKRNEALPSPPLPPSPLSPTPPIPAPTRTPTPAEGARTHTRGADDGDFMSASALQLPSTASPMLQTAWAEWQAYRQRRHRAKGRDRLKWTLQAAHLSARQLIAAAAEHGEQIAADRISSAIVGSWQGLNFDKMNKPRTPSNPHDKERDFNLF